jgi:hypothetical protein|tara:strand:- start:949 stop:1212 length:264 start_codon:yes stop_codon:yes gene_type:complete
MSYLIGRSHDPILRDIKQAVKEGYFDSPEYQDNKLINTPVEQLLVDVAMMSRLARRAYLLRIGKFRTNRTSLSGVVKKAGRKVRLSR